MKKNLLSIAIIAVLVVAMVGEPWHGLQVRRRLKCIQCRNR